MGQMILALSGAALLCGVLLSIPQEGLMKELVKLLCAVALTICALTPLTRLRWQSFSLDGTWSQAGWEYAAQGEKQAQEALAAIIQEQTRSYIMDKARELGLDLNVEIELGAGNVPTAVKLTGAASPYQRGRMERILTQELGIAKEKLQWTG